MVRARRRCINLFKSFSTAIEHYTQCVTTPEKPRLAREERPTPNLPQGVDPPSMYSREPCRGARTGGHAPHTKRLIPIGLRHGHEEVHKEAHDVGVDLHGTEDVLIGAELALLVAAHHHLSIVHEVRAKDERAPVPHGPRERVECEKLSSEPEGERESKETERRQGHRSGTASGLRGLEGLCA